MVTSIGEDPLRMADRRDLLGRALRVVACSPFDGLLGSPDIIDELFALEGAASKKFLDRKLLIGSANRGGLSGTVFELDDRVTGFDAKGIARMKLDAGKFLLRMDPDDQASLRTLEYCVSFLRECEELGIPVFLELLPVTRKEGRPVVVRDADGVCVRRHRLQHGSGSSFLTWTTSARSRRRRPARSSSSEAKRVAGGTSSSCRWPRR